MAPSRSRERDRSRSRSPRRDDRREERPRRDDRESRDDRERRPQETELDMMRLSEDDAAWILGRGGSTKQKISTVSGAELSMNERESGSLEITGTRKQRRAARDYIEMIIQQRSSSVVIDIDEPREDMTGLSVPSECVAFVMGKGGATLRTLESEWGALMFFAKVGGKRSEEKKEMLMIFGPIHARRGAELKVMSTVEYKKPGTYTTGKHGTDDYALSLSKRLPGDRAPDDWDVDWMPLEVQDHSYALGTKGATRKKLAIASGCIIEYVGHIACMCGSKKERRRARDYLRWLLKQRQGPVKVNADSREDVSVLTIPTDSIGFISGHRGESLRNIEIQTGTFCFINDGTKKLGEKGNEEDMLVFSHSDESRKIARRKIREQVEVHARLGGRSGQVAPPQGAPDRRDFHGATDRRDVYDDRRGREYFDPRYPQPDRRERERERERDRRDWDEDRRVRDRERERRDDWDRGDWRRHEWSRPNGYNYYRDGR